MIAFLPSGIKNSKHNVNEEELRWLRKCHSMNEMVSYIAADGDLEDNRYPIVTH
jgi:hypothetical protein